jgi:hypothetical protein
MFLPHGDFYTILPGPPESRTVRDARMFAHLYADQYALVTPAAILSYEQGFHCFSCGWIMPRPARGNPGRVEENLFPVQVDRAFVLLVEAGEYIHQSCLAERFRPATHGFPFPDAKIDGPVATTSPKSAW